MTKSSANALEGLIWLALFGGFCGGWLYFSGRSDQHEDPSKYPLSDKSYDDVVSDVGCSSNSTDTKKKEIWDRHYYHHWVTWQGTVFKADASWVQVNVHAFTYDFEVQFQNNRAGFDLTKGDAIKVRFLLNVGKMRRHTAPGMTRMSPSSVLMRENAHRASDCGSGAGEHSVCRI